MLNAILIEQLDSARTRVARLQAEALGIQNERSRKAVLLRLEELDDYLRLGIIALDYINEVLEIEQPLPIFEELPSV